MSAHGGQAGFLALAMQTLAEHSTQAMITLDSDGNIQDCNPATSVLLQYPAKALVGRPYADLVPPESIGHYQSVLGKARRGRRLSTELVPRLRQDGTEASLSFELHAVFGAKKALAGFVALHSDVSEVSSVEDQLEHQTAYVQAILETVVDGIITIDEHGNMIAVNPAVEKMFGYRGHELIGQNVRMLMPEPYHSDHDGYLRNFMRTGRAKIIGIGREVPALRKDGSEFPIDLAVGRLNSGDEVGFVGVLRDISERRAAQAKLRQLNQALESKVEELHRTLNELKEMQGRVIEAEKMASLGALVGGVAHEINTPLGVCLTASSYLGDTAEKLQAQLASGQLRKSDLERFIGKINETAALVEANLARAGELVHSFKQVAVDRSSNRRRRFKLRTFVDELLASLAPEWRFHQLDIQVDCPDSIELDSYPGVLSQVLTNLVQNAVRHAFSTDDQGEIRIAAEDHGDAVLLRVSDNGAGIPEENRIKVFEPFFTTSRSKGGTGLGLSVTFNLVRQVLGGEIRLTSVVGEGSCFSIQMPKSPQAPAEFAAAESGIVDQNAAAE